MRYHCPSKPTSTHCTAVKSHALNAVPRKSDATQIIDKVLILTLEAMAASGKRRAGYTCHQIRSRETQEGNRFRLIQKT